MSGRSEQDPYTWNIWIRDSETVEKTTGRGRDDTPYWPSGRSGKTVWLAGKIYWSGRKRLSEIGWKQRQKKRTIYQGGSTFKMVWSVRNCGTETAGMCRWWSKNSENNSPDQPYQKCVWDQRDRCSLKWCGETADRIGTIIKDSGKTVANIGRNAENSGKCRGTEKADLRSGIAELQ